MAEASIMRMVRPTLVGTSPLLLLAHDSNWRWGGVCRPPQEPPRGLTDERLRRWVHEQVAQSVPQRDGGCGIETKTLLESLAMAGVFVRPSRGSARRLTVSRRSDVPSLIRIADTFLPFPDGEFQEWALDIDHGHGQTGDFAAIFRARFDRWAIRPTLQFDAEHISEERLRTLVEIAGVRVGLGSCRPERRGRFGRFVVTQWETVSDDAEAA